MDLTELINKPEIIDDLLVDLDKISRDVNLYEYGLPIDHYAEKALLRSAVIKWAANLQKNENDASCHKHSQHPQK